MINREVRVELRDSIKMDESFNELLINHGYAEKWEETPQSRLNHDQRRRALLARDDSKGILRLEKVDEKGVYNPDDVIEVEVNFDSNDKTKNVRSLEKIIIKGPYSPLEV